MTPDLRDSVTDLPTRELLCEHVDIALARARETNCEVALLHFGLDGFALVNSSLGHAAGDRILHEAGDRVRARVPAQHVVARARGDELCVLVADLPAGASDRVDDLGRSVLEALREPYAVGGGTAFELGATAGVSVFPTDAHDGSALLRHADSALQQAKESHRGELVFYAGGTSEALYRLLIASRLRDALEAKQFFLEYQPIVALPERRVVAVEALLRWNSDQGRVPPLEFIPFAEENGLIVPIGEWVLDAACTQAEALAAAGHEVAVSFNVSPRQLQDGALVARLRDRVASSGLDPRRLIVEVTESTVMGEGHDYEPFLRALEDIGVRLAIDDFGAGHSSLSRLRDLPVELLKLDGTFLANTPGDERAVRLVVAALGLAHALGMRTVVEGVETAAQVDFLRDEAAELLQGFHLARPMAAPALEGLLAS